MHESKSYAFSEYFSGVDEISTLLLVPHFLCVFTWYVHFLLSKEIG